MKNLILLLVLTCTFASKGYSQSASIDTMAYASADTMAYGNIDLNEIQKQLDKELETCTSTANCNSIVTRYTAYTELLLNQTYKLALAKCTPTFKPKLIASQKVWIAYKENDLKLLGDLYRESPGTMYTTSAGLRVFEILKERTTFLQHIIERF